MKIAMPVTDHFQDAMIYSSFGRAPYFAFYDSELKTVEFVGNNAATTQGGAGIKAAQMIVDQKTDVLIAPRCGENSLMVLEGAKVAIFLSPGGTIQDNIQAFQAGKLSKMQDFHPGYHGHHGQ